MAKYIYVTCRIVLIGIKRRRGAPPYAPRRRPALRVRPGGRSRASAARGIAARVARRASRSRRPSAAPPNEWPNTYACSEEFTNDFINSIRVHKAAGRAANDYTTLMHAERKI
ncbi:hypothetical protein [Nonomuraea polychroma]|uniref:hypothetical protein n=1 Tax=Nonomuraea polychroma TaxID=46176 RepID=UPI000FDE3B8D|nr:hypothetical protein [Nonomuraea polychroma]